MKELLEGLEAINKIASGPLNLNSAIARRKLKSELVRILFYIANGYQGPHPWGLLARPIYPEISPLPVKDKNAGKEMRELVESLMDKSYWDQFVRILLRELKTKLEDSAKKTKKEKK